MTGISARKKRALTATVAGLAGLTIGGAARAAGEGDAPLTAAGRESGEVAVSGITVESQKTQENNPKLTVEPIRNPQTITVVSRGVIAAQNLLSLRDILSTVPGITFGAGEGGGGFGDSINLRGYSANNDITVDNVRDSAQYSRSDPFNLEQLEVTNGSNSVYTGAGSVGGSINIVSKRPTARNTTTVSAAVGTDDYYRGTVDSNYAIDENVAVRLNAMVHRNDAPGRDVEKFKRFGIAPSVTVGLNGPTQFTAMYYYQRDKNTPQYGVPYYNGGAVPGVDRSNYYGYSNLDTQRQQVSMLTGILDHDFGKGFSVRNLSRYQRVTQFILVDPPQGVFCLSNGLKPTAWVQTSLTASNLTGYTACTGTDPGPGFYAPSGPRGNLRNSKNTLLYNQTDLTWSGELAGVQHNLVVGVSVLEEDFRLDTGNILRSATGVTLPLAPMNIANPNNVYSGPTNYIRASRQFGERKNQAIYFFDNITLNEQWSINGGLRYEHNEGVNWTDTSSVVVGPTLGQVTPGVRNESDDNLLTYRVGLVYQPMPNASLYVAYGNSQTPSQATVNASGACVAATNCTVDPEKAEIIEVGGKWDVQGRLSLTAAIFRNKRSNYRVVSPDPILFPVMQLDGSARVDGVALGATGKITDDWAVFANYTYLKSKVLRGVNKADAAAGRDWTKGDALLQVPDHAFSLFTTYDIRSLKLQVGYGVSYQGESYLTQHAQIAGVTPPTRTTIPLVKSDDYWVHRLTVAYYPVEQLEVRLNVNNLFDKKYFTRIRNNGWATPGDRRNATLTANYRF